jgi:outer membrane protein OmpA-like peptidoglycan-associated protein
VSKGKLLAVCVVWLSILGAGVTIWKYVLTPARQASDQQEQERLLSDTSSPSRYEHRITFHLDSFSGYALLRSDELRRELAARRIDLKLIDDQADYATRLAALRDGNAQMAVFTVDALIKASASARDLPATIVALLDETTGADAIVGYRDAVPNVDALNQAGMRFVLTMDSPSETLARVVMSRFQLDRLEADPFVKATDAADVFRRYKQARPADRQVYVVWEPFVSKMLENPALHVVADSAGFPATIVDVIVAGRDFLVKNEEVVRKFVEAYLRVVYHYRERDAKVRLVMSDAQQQKLELTEAQAQKLVDGIWWKNTQENLAHMGLPAARPLLHVEDIIRNLTDVLTSTGAMERDPTDGKPHHLYRDKIMKDLQNFHPGDGSEDVRDVQLPELSDEQWQRLQPAGTARMPELVFARGTDRLTEASRHTLDELARRLTTTRYYVVVRGNASRVGDLQANQELAGRRAKAAQEYLVTKGIDRKRIRASGVEPSGSTSVSFFLGQLPY